jgi:hypothetical protein
MRLQEWSWWKVAGAILLWVVAGLALIGWSLLRTAKALEGAQPSGQPGMVLVAFKWWQLSLLLIPPIIFLVSWVSPRRGRE